MRLIIKRSGSLLPVVLDREITTEQEVLIGKILELTDNPEVDVDQLAFDTDLSIALLGYDAPLGAGESVEAFRG